MVILLFIGLYFTIYLFNNIKKDTTTLTNVTFGILATFANLSFSCSRAINGSGTEKDKELFQFAGEKFLHGSIFLITSSIFKYTLLSINNPNVFVEIILGYMVPVLFLTALTTSHGGLVIINKLLWKRFNRYIDWDNLW